MPPKPRHRTGYEPAEFELVKAACLTLAVTLGEHLDEVCIVGGLVPALLIDAHRHHDNDDDPHPGTNDLDIGLALGLLDDARYAQISDRLRAEGFEPDTNHKGNPTVQRWHKPGMKVTIDFLMPPPDGAADDVRVQPLEPDFGALITPGLGLAFNDRVQVRLEGHTLDGAKVARHLPVCGPAAFVVLKALAFRGRGEPKDAFDLIYVLRYADGGANHIADRLADHATSDPNAVNRALMILTEDFGELDSIGPQRAAEFTLPAGAPADEVDASMADSHGYVDDLLRAVDRQRKSRG